MSYVVTTFIKKLIIKNDNQLANDIKPGTQDNVSESIFYSVHVPITILVSSIVNIHLLSLMFLIINVLWIIWLVF